MEKSLRAMGIEPGDTDAIQKNESVRRAYRKFLLVHRYVNETKRPYAELVTEARAASSIETYPDVLHAAR